jgi:nucleotide-binding universal stress UspA family protein
MDTTISQKRIMVQIADPHWTHEVLHQACILAREMKAEIVLLKMVPVQHVQWLGTEFGAMDFTLKDRAELRDYEATVEDYGLLYSSTVFQYLTLTEAIADAADHINADFIFATLPNSLIPYWREYQLHNLRQRFVRQHRHLIEIDCK